MLVFFETLLFTVATAPVLGYVDGDAIQLEDLSNEYTALVHEYSDTKDLVLRVKKATSCSGLRQLNVTKDGAYYIYAGEDFLLAHCEFDETIAGGNNWMVVQRRINGSVDFFRDWKSYVDGFGDHDGEFWIGLENLHKITTLYSNTLRVEIDDFDGNTIFAEYSTFVVGDWSTNYTLTVGGYTGDGGDSMSYHNGQKFSTHDVDHDKWTGSCSNVRHGAWWYNACAYANLNGKYVGGGVTDQYGIHWFKWKTSHYSMKSVAMKIKPN